MFSQVDHSLERSQGGLGIGLALVKGLVEMHGGTVEARSAGVGQGSEFVVRLPVARQTPSSARTRRPLRDHAARSSAAHPRLSTTTATQPPASPMMLSLLGHETRTAHDGLEALEMAEAFRPDLMLLDIGLPKLNGYDVCRRIRAQPWGKDVFMVAVTGWGQEDDRRRSEKPDSIVTSSNLLDSTSLQRILADLPGSSLPPAP